MQGPILEISVMTPKEGAVGVWGPELVAVAVSAMRWIEDRIQGRIVSSLR